MPKIDLSIFADNDPTFAFNLYDKRGRTRTPTDLTGATVECIVKATAATKDIDADATYIGTTTATAGQAVVAMDSEVVGGDNRQFYHVDVIRNGRRQTYAWGLLKKIGFS